MAIWRRRRDALTHVDVHLNARLQPVHRGEVYEDPLGRLLQARFPGSSVVGGGTLTNKEGEPLSCDIEVELSGDVEAAIEASVSLLESCGAPRGSSISHDEQPASRFGRTEGVGLYLNGTDLPDEVYATSDVNELLEQIDIRLGTEGKLQSYWEGPTETALYLYGSSADRIEELLADLIATHPLTQLSRLTPIT